MVKRELQGAPGSPDAQDRGHSVDSPEPSGAPPTPASGAESIVPVVAGDLFRTYRSARKPGVEALRAFTLRLESSESLALLGPNGSGKTTAIRLLLGLDAPDRGEVRLFGRDPTDRRARARLGYLPEETNLFPFLNADETLHLAGRLHGLDRRERRSRVDRLVEVLGLVPARRRRVATYSRGMARRLAFARAILTDPELLVLDEPTAGLDPEGAEVVFDLVEEARARGAAVLFSTHILREAEARCQRLIIVVQGRTVCEGTLDEVLGAEEPQLSVSGLAAPVREELLAWVAGHGGAVREERGRRRSLERLFRERLEASEP